MKYFTSFTKAFQYSCIQLILWSNIWWDYISKYTRFYITLSTIDLPNLRSKCVNLIAILDIYWWINTCFRILLLIILNENFISINIMNIVNKLMRLISIADNNKLCIFVWQMWILLDQFLFNIVIVKLINVEIIIHFIKGLILWNQWSILIVFE